MTQMTYWGKTKSLLVALIACSLASIGMQLPAHAVTNASNAFISTTRPTGGPSYSYSPTEVEFNNMQYIYYCAVGRINSSSPETDSIYRVTYNLSNGTQSSPQQVLAPSANAPGQFDDWQVCNPSIITGSFTPFGDGLTYTWALYYTATGTKSDGSHDHLNRIGVAFSNDGVNFRRYGTAVIYPKGDNGSNYGAGEPATYNYNGAGGITMTYYDQSTQYPQYLTASSSDGTHFGPTTPQSTSGMTYHGAYAFGQPISWHGADFGYDQNTNQWYAVVDAAGDGHIAPNCVNGQPQGAYDTVDGYEGGDSGFDYYVTSAANFANGTGGWTFLARVDTNLSGYETNQLPGLERDRYGNVSNTHTYPAIVAYYSVSAPRPGGGADERAEGGSGMNYGSGTGPGSNPCPGGTQNAFTWQIAYSIYYPNQTKVQLTRYYSSSLNTREATTGYADPSLFTGEISLGTVSEVPTSAATIPLFGCKAGGYDFFISTSATCEGQHVLGLEGWVQGGQNSGDQPIYRCSTSRSIFISLQANCEGFGNGNLLGYTFTQ